MWRLDNRGSFGRGHGFETPIFGQLGKAALDDQLAGVEYLKTLPYPVPNTSRSFHGDALVARLTASTNYLEGCLGGQR